MWKTIIFFTISIHTILLIDNTSSNMTTAKLIKTLIKEDYKFTRPASEDNKPSIVNIHLVIRSIDDISDKKSNFNIRYYLTLYWYDPRLRFTPFQEDNETINNIHLPMSIVKENGME